MVINIEKPGFHQDFVYSLKYHIDDISVLENTFLKAVKSENINNVSISNEEESEEEILIQYGIASEEQYKKALNMQTFRDNFVYISSHDISKFVFVNQILERAKKNIINFLRNKSEYDLSNIIEIDKTMFIVEKIRNRYIL